MVQYFTMFPVCYGYHSDSLLNMRTTAAYELLARLMYLFAVICLAQWTVDRGFMHMRAVCSIAALLVLVFCILSGRLLSDIKSGFSFETAISLKDGSMQEAYRTRVYVLNALDLAEDGSDVYLNVPLADVPESAYGMGLSEDPNDFVNRSAAGLFHLNSVSVEYID